MKVHDNTDKQLQNNNITKMQWRKRGEIKKSRKKEQNKSPSWKNEKVVKY